MALGADYADLVVVTRRFYHLKRLRWWWSIGRAQMVHITSWHFTVQLAGSIC